MSLNDFDFQLPPELIAQQPTDRRDQSRLLALDRRTGDVSHHRFDDLPDLLRPGDALVLNDTRVMRARLRADRRTGGKVELLLLRTVSDRQWEAMARPAGRLRIGERLSLADGSGVVVNARLPGGTIVVEAAGEGSDWLERLGDLPLPPYITEFQGDPERYQTVYARASGSAAAPTAGLHFTADLLRQLRERDISLFYVTLHVGPGTFQPVKVDRIEDHRMHSEQFFVQREVIDGLAAVRRSGGRIVAVGTTSVRTLETVARRPERVGVWSDTDLFITPGFEFQLVDAMITNFHLPKSTLMMLIAAMAGLEPVLRAYSEAIRERYRFYSFGDAMLIL